MGKIFSYLVWEVMLIARGPIRLLLTIITVLSLALTAFTLVAIPFGGMGEIPIVDHVLSALVFGLAFAIAAGLRYGYDSIIFKLTPEGRTVWFNN